jgi:hypothetical protein
MVTEEQGKNAVKFIETVIDKMKPLQKLTNVNMAIHQLGENKELISDGYHTFKELYDFRMVYNAVLFNEWADMGVYNPDGLFAKPMYDVHKSWKHHDGELCFGGGWFIVSAMLPTGLISNHYKVEHWDLFKIPEVEKALFEFDGHTSQDVLNRLKNLI